MMAINKNNFKHIQVSFLYFSTPILLKTLPAIWNSFLPVELSVILKHAAFGYPVNKNKTFVISLRLYVEYIPISN